MREITVTLAGRAFAVQQLPILRAARWQETAKPLVEPIAEMAIASGLATPTPDRMSKLAFTLGLFIDPIPMLDAVCAYSPALAAERDWIGDNAYADELLEALLTLFFGMRATPPANGAPPKPSPTT